MVKNVTLFHGVWFSYRGFLFPLPSFLPSLIPSSLPFPSFFLFTKSRYFKFLSPSPYVISSLVAVLHISTPKLEITQTFQDGKRSVRTQTHTLWSLLQVSIFCWMWKSPVLFFYESDPSVLSPAPLALTAKPHYGLSFFFICIYVGLAHGPLEKVASQRKGQWSGLTCPRHGPPQSEPPLVPAHCHPSP